MPCYNLADTEPTRSDRLKIKLAIYRFRRRYDRHPVVVFVSPHVRDRDGVQGVRVEARSRNTLGIFNACDEETV